MIIGAVFMGWALGSLILPPLADQFGRKEVMVFSLILMIFTSIALLINKSVTSAILLMLCYGFTVPGTTLVTYVYAMEFVHPKRKVFATMAFICSGAFGYILVTLYYWLISTSYYYITVLQLTLALFPVAGLVSGTIPESPLLLLK